MLEELYPVAKHTPFTLLVTPASEGRLNVIITPRPPKDGGAASLSAHIEAVGTPEELDRELPKALAAYASKVNDVRLAIKLPIDALEADLAKGAAKKDKKAKAPRPAKKAAAPKARTRSAKKTAAAAPKGPKLAKPKVKAKAKKAVRPAARRTTTPIPAARKIRASRPDAGHLVDGHLSNKPGKDACIADLKAMQAKHGDKLTRRLFIKKSETGRRYEKLWKNWEAFLAEAQGKKAAPQSSPNTAENGNGQREDRARPDVQGSKPRKPRGTARAATAATPPATSKSEGSLSKEPSEAGGAAPSKTAIDPLANWPFPVRSAKEHADGVVRNRNGESISSPLPRTDRGWDVYDETKRYIAPVTTEPKLGMILDLTGQGIPYPRRVTATEGLRVYTRVWSLLPADTGNKKRGVAGHPALVNADEHIEFKAEGPVRADAYFLQLEDGWIFAIGWLLGSVTRPADFDPDKAKRHASLDEALRAAASGITVHAMQLIEQAAEAELLPTYTKLRDWAIGYHHGGVEKLREDRDKAAKRGKTIPIAPAALDRVVQLYTSTGVHLGSTNLIRKAGERYDSDAHGPWTVVEVRDDRYILVRPEEAPAGSTPPPGQQ